MQVVIIVVFTLVVPDSSLLLQLRLLDTLEDCLKHPIDEIQAKAVAAVKVFTNVYFPVGAQGKE